MCTCCGVSLSYIRSIGGVSLFFFFFPTREASTAVRFNFGRRINMHCTAVSAEAAQPALVLQFTRFRVGESIIHDFYRTPCFNTGWQTCECIWVHTEVWRILHTLPR